MPHQERVRQMRGHAAASTPKAALRIQRRCSGGQWADAERKEHLDGRTGLALSDDDNGQSI
eukprot:489254-Pyramimonas_sp.AAC.1